MITIGMNYQVLPGKESVFERAFQSVLDAMKNNPGHSSSRLFREISPAGHDYLILSEWASQAAFDEFVRSEAFAKVTNWGKEQVLARRPVHQTYSVVAP